MSPSSPLPDTSPGPAALDAHLGYWLRYVSNHVSQAFARRLADRGVTVAEWVVLRTLLDGETAPSQLAQRIGMTRGAITRLADRLIAKQLITRSADTSDGRAQRLALTAAGRDLVPALAQAADDNDAAFFGHLASEDRAALERALKDLVRHHGLRALPVD